MAKKKRKKILVVDDDELCRMTLEMVLVKAGYEISMAEDGIEGLEKYKKSPCDLAFIDLMMPNMGGVELFAELQKLNPDITVIILTAHDEIDSYLELKSMGAFEYLVKPVNLGVVKQMVTSIFASKK